MFVCGGDKQFIVRCYIDTGFVTNTNKVLSQLDYVTNRRWRSGLEDSSMLDLDEFQS